MGELMFFKGDTLAVKLSSYSIDRIGLSKELAFSKLTIPAKLFR